MKLAISLLTSAGTLVGMWVAGNGKAWAWLIGLANQALWLLFIAAFAAWGLLPLSLALIVIYSRNYVKWRREGAS